MSLSILLRAGVVAAFAWALAALAVLTARTLSQGRRPIYALPAGSARRGVIYAFFQGMAPWEKESVSGHLPTFVGGLLYHAGVFLALLFLFLLIGGVQTGAPLRQIIGVGTAVGLASGFGLLIKRSASRKMRMISVPDDFLANLIVDLFLAAACAAAISSIFEHAFLGLAIVLLFYIPLGKIRHCVFFFYTRVVFGSHFGRRAVFPHPRTET